MRWHGGSARAVRPALGVAVAALAWALSAAPAWGQAAAISASNAASFGQAAYPHQAGTVASFSNTGGGRHNVTSTARGPDGGPLFRSATIPVNGFTGVGGTQYVPAGSFPFICTVHPQMQANLNVAGTPRPRPNVRLRIRSRRLVPRIRVRLVFRSHPAENHRVRLVARLGRRVIARRAISFGPGQVRRVRVVTLRMNRAGRRAIRNRARARVRVIGRVAFGRRARAGRVLPR